MTPGLIVVIYCTPGPGPSHLILSLSGASPLSRAVLCRSRLVHLENCGHESEAGIPDLPCRVSCSPCPGPRRDPAGRLSFLLETQLSSRAGKRSPLPDAQGNERSWLAAGHARRVLAVAESERLAHIARAAGEAGSRGAGLGASPSGVSVEGHGGLFSSGLFLPRPLATSCLGRSRHSVRSVVTRRADPR